MINNDKHHQEQEQKQEQKKLLAVTEAIQAAILKEGAAHFVDYENGDYSVHGFWEYHSGYTKKPRSHRHTLYDVKMHSKSVQIVEHNTGKVCWVYPMPRLQFDLYHYQEPWSVIEKRAADEKIPPELWAKLPHTPEQYAMVWQSPNHASTDRGYYRKIARISVRNLNQVFEMTQHDQAENFDWTEGRFVTLTRTGYRLGRHRSTSVGDVVVLPVISDSDDEETSYTVGDLEFLVEPCGYSLLPTRSPVNCGELFPNSFPTPLNLKLD